MKTLVPLALLGLLLMGASPDRRSGGQSRGSSGASGSRSSAAPQSGGSRSSGGGSHSSGGGSRSSGRSVSPRGGGGGNPSAGHSAPAPRGDSGGSIGRSSGGSIDRGGFARSGGSGGGEPSVIRIPSGDHFRSGGDILRIPSGGASGRGADGGGVPAGGAQGRGHAAAPSPYDDARPSRSAGSANEDFPRFVTQRPRGSLGDARPMEGSGRSGPGSVRPSLGGREGSGSASPDRRYRDRSASAPADLPRRDGAAGGRGSSASPGPSRGKGGEPAAIAGRETSPRTSGSRGPGSSTIDRGSTGPKRTLETARRETSRSFAKDPSVLLGPTFQNHCWNWGVNWSSHCRSSWAFGWGPSLFSPWCTTWWGWHAWWGWSWGRSRWCWSWGGWWDPFWSWSWYWPWSASVVYVPATTAVYYDSPGTTIYVDSPAPVVVRSEEGTTVVEESPSRAGYAGGVGGSLSEKYVRLADLYFRAGRYDRAVDHYLRAVEASPEQASLRFMLADALFAIGDYHFAAHSIRRALEKDATIVESLANKRDFYGDPADYDIHLAQLERFLADHGNDGDAWLVLGYNHYFTGKTAEAKGAFTKAKERLAPDVAVDLFLAAADVREAEASRPAAEAATQPAGAVR